MKIYNLCDDNEYILYKNLRSPTHPGVGWRARADFKIMYQHFFVNEKGFHHRLDGSSIKYYNHIEQYFINNFLYSKDHYWNHPDVIAYKYLKEHPELEAFV